MSFELMAGPSDVRGISAKDSGMAGASLVSRPGAFSAKGNPALLPSSPKSLSLETYGDFFWLDDNNISSPNTTPPSGIAKDTHRASNMKPENNFGLGICVPFTEKFAVGLAGRFPSDSVAKIHAFTENEATYLHFNDRQARPEMFTAVAYKFSPHFSLGTGLFYSLKAKGTMQLGVSRTDAESRMYLELLPEFIPYLGFASSWNLFGRDTNFGLVYRMEQRAQSKVDVDLDFDVGLGTIPFSASSELVAFYDPATLTFGFTREGHRVRPSLSYEWARWSKYKAPVVSLSGKDLDTLNSGRTLATNIQLRDTHTVKLGAEFPEIYQSAQNTLAVRMGMEFQSSAVDENTSNLTVVDSDKWSATAGLGLRKPSLKFVTNAPINFDAAFRFTHLIETDFIDQNKNQHRRSKSGGEVASLLLGVTLEI